MEAARFRLFRKEQRACTGLGLEPDERLQQYFYRIGKNTGDGQVMIDASRLKAHRTAASLPKKGLFPAASDAQGAG